MCPSNSSDVTGLSYHQLYVDTAMPTNVLNGIEIVANPRKGRRKIVQSFLLV